MAGKQIIGVLFSLASACFLHFLYRLYKNRRWFNGLPQPPHSFIWGHLKVMGEVSSTMPPNMHPQAYITAIAQKYNLKGIFYLDLWPVADSMVILTDPDLMNKVTVVKSLAMHTMAEAFISPIVGPVVVDECMLFRDTLDTLAQTGEVFFMEETSAKLVFDVIARIVFNFPLHAQTKGSSYLTDLRDMIRLADAQLSWNPVVKMRAYFRRKKIFDRLQVSIVGKIYERLNLLRSEKIVPSRKDPFSILDLMLREQVQEEGGDATGKISEDLSPEYLELLVTNIKGLLVGGHGTTTDTLCYIYMLLSKSPEALEKVRQEHSQVFHKDFTETLNILRDSPQKLDELEYTTAVIKETLRLFPVGFGVREAEDGATITYNGQTYPIDNHLAVIPTAHTLHYDPEHYSNPAKFQPERFLDPENAIPRANFRTFGRGPRACLGQNLAQDELRIILLMTLRDYEFECAGLKPNKEPKTSWTELDTVFGDIAFQELGLEAKPRGGMMMRCTKAR